MNLERVEHPIEVTVQIVLGVCKGSESSWNLDLRGRGLANKEVGLKVARIEEGCGLHV